MATAQDIFDETRRIIHDEEIGNYRWADAELIDYLNAGTRQIVVLLPEANSIESIEDTGLSRVARQVLPAGGIKFIRAGRNYADDGTTPQGTVRYVEFSYQSIIDIICNLINRLIVETKFHITYNSINNCRNTIILQVTR